MEQSKPCLGPPYHEVYRVIDNGICVLATLDPRKALLKLEEIIEKHDVTACWADIEVLK